MNYRLRHLYCTALLLASALGLAAEANYPIIGSDRSATFRIYAPGAEEVTLSGTMLPASRRIKTPAGTFGKQGKAEMKPATDTGWWEYTVKELESGLYTYNFTIDDGQPLIDSLNTCLIREGNDSTSFFIVRGGIGDDFSVNDVPHGKVQEAWYPSTLADFERRRMMIYLPSGYASGSKRYPVLYLLHGSGGDEEAWLDCGRLAQIMDNLIADGRCKPMIVVMPNGIADMAAAPGKDPDNREQQSSSVNIESMLGKIELAFMTDVVRYVDNNFRTIATKQGRAIAGLSLGGLQTIFISANNPGAFDYVGLFSAQATNALNDRHISIMGSLSDSWNSVASALPFLKNRGLGKRLTDWADSQEALEIYGDFDNKLAAQFADPPALYYITLGSDDFVKKLNDDLRKKLDDKCYKYMYIETDGGHTWDNWRRYLIDFAPRLFK